MTTTMIYSPEGQAADLDGAAAKTPVNPLSGRRIAVLDNGKTGATLLLSRLAENLAARTRSEFVGVYRKGSAATPCEPELLARLEQEADLVLTGTAD